MFICKITENKSGKLFVETYTKGSNIKFVSSLSKKDKKEIYRGIRKDGYYGITYHPPITNSGMTETLLLLGDEQSYLEYCIDRSISEINSENEHTD